MPADEGPDETTQKHPQLEPSSGQLTTSATKEGTVSSQSEEHAERTAVQDKRITSLETTVTRLQAQITETESLLNETREKLSAATSPDQGDPAAIVRRHIRLLHEYNEIKDIGQGLMGLIADARGVRHVDVQTEFGIGSKD